MESSIKRVRHVESGPGVYEQLSAEPAILELITTFVPLARGCARAHDSSELTSHLKTISAFAQVFPVLGKRIGPRNQQYWRLAVLRHFDFAEGQIRFNVEESDDDWWMRWEARDGDNDGASGAEEEEDEEDDEEDDEEGEEVRGNDERARRLRLIKDRVIRAAVIEWEKEHPNPMEQATPVYMLRRDQAEWPSVGCYFRPSEYGFLGAIQRGEATLSSWPEHEDALTLYVDLVLMQDRLHKIDAQGTKSVPMRSMFPCLLGNLHKEISPKAYELFDHCDFVPYYWNGFVKRYDDIDKPLPDVYKLVGDAESEERDFGSENDEMEEDDYDDDDAIDKPKKKQTAFPVEGAMLARLMQLVHERFDDWRVVCANDDGAPTPYFYIGRSKASGRWLGFVGESEDPAYFQL